MAKAQDKDRKRLQEMLAATALTFRVAFLRYVDKTTSPEILGEILIALEAGKQTEALSIIQSQVGSISTPVADAFIQVGKETAIEIEAGIGGAGGGAGGGGVAAGGFNARIGIGFDPTFPRAAEIMRTETQNFIQGLSQQQIAATREAMATAYQNGWGTAETARAIRGSIGLTPYQMKIVENYETALRQGKSVKDRQLRDRRLDRAVDAAQRRGKPLTDQQIQRMVDSYRTRFINYRAETIARTESTRVASLAREETYRQMAEKMGIGNNRLIRIWNATLDNRVRDWHESMDGDEAALGQPFVDGLGNNLMYPGDSSAPPETIINCRCTLSFRLA